MRGPLVEVEGFQRRLTTSIHYAPSLGALRDVLVQYQGGCRGVEAGVGGHRNCGRDARGGCRRWKRFVVSGVQPSEAKSEHAGGLV